MPKPSLVLASALALLASAVSQSEAAPYREQLDKGCDSNRCVLNYPKVPANRVVSLEFVSCLADVAGGNLVNLFISSSPAPKFFHYPSSAWTRVVGSRELTNFSEPMGLTLKAGERLRVDAQAGGGIVFVTCAFYGEIENAP